MSCNPQGLSRAVQLFFTLLYIKIQTYSKFVQFFFFKYFQDITCTGKDGGGILIRCLLGCECSKRTAYADGKIPQETRSERPTTRFLFHIYSTQFTGHCA